MFCDMSKKIQVKRHEDSYFYKALDVMPEEILPDLHDSAVKWLETTRKPITKEVYPPEASAQLLAFTDFVTDPLWIKFYKEIRTHIAKYCQVTGMDLSTIRVHSSWITRVADIEFPGKHTKAQLRKRLSQHSTFGNMHSHTDNPIGVVYYLKNPSPKYGTIVQLTENKIFNNDGEENSLMVFNPQLYHTALYPTLEEVKKYPRMTIVCDTMFN